MPSSACGGEQLLEDPNIAAELTSPKFPEAYPNHQDCEWKLKVPEGHIVEFSFTVFNISSSFTCRDDYVELSNFPNGRGSIGKFCGNNIPQNQSYRSSGDEFYVRFRSKAVSNERNSGFKALWKIGKQFALIRNCHVTYVVSILVYFVSMFESFSVHFSAE